MFEQPSFWGVIVFVALLAYLLGVRRRGGAHNAPVVKSAPTVPAMPARKPGSVSGAAMQLVDVRSWGYQLQDLDLVRAAASPFDLLVIDYTKDGSEATRLKPAEIERLKDRKSVV